MQGTNVEEHRINPQLVDGINKALDAALEDPSVHVVVVTAAGKVNEPSAVFRGHENLSHSSGVTGWTSSTSVRTRLR